MYKLLKANFFRLKKKQNILLSDYNNHSNSKIYIIQSYETERKETKEGFPLTSLKSTDRLVMDNHMFIGIIMAIFTSLFVGTEYSDGAIRNKIVEDIKEKIYI